MGKVKNVAGSESDEDGGDERPIRGIAKSGRIWKTVSEKRFSKLKRDKGFNTNWEKKKALKTQTQVVKALANEIVEERKTEKREKREKAEERKKRKLENERKSEIVQVIKDSRKIKRLKKKQLRTIEKRDTNEMAPTKS